MRRRTNFFMAIVLVALTLGLAVCTITEPKMLRHKPIAVVKEVDRPIREPVPSAAKSLETFQNEYPTSAMAWDYHTGYVKQISNFLGPPAAEPNNAEAAALEFVLDNAALFGVDRTKRQLRAVQVKESTAQKGETINRRFIRFHQMEQGIPVYQGEIIVHLTSSSRVYAVYNSLKPLTSIEGKMALTEAEAVKRARGLLNNVRIFGDHVRAERVIFPLGERGIRSWGVYLDHWYIILNGDTGDTLMIKDMARYVRDARVFLENNEVNNSTTVIRSITNLDNSGYLSGTRFVIDNQSGEDAYSPTNYEFRDPPTDVNFDDQMAYYHLETLASFFNNIDVPDPTSPVEARTRVGLYCNAYYSPDEDILAFGLPGSTDCDGTTCVSAAHFADIIYHEFTHRVLDTEVGLNYDSTESGAIHEGTADYYSSSVLGNPCLAEHFYAGRTCLRDISQFRRYPNNMDNEPHRGGEVWASALWDLRDEVGAVTADRIIREGMKGLPADADFSTFAGNIVVQGAAYYLNFISDDAWMNFFILLQVAGATEGAKKTFCEHGIAVPYGSYVDMLITTPKAGSSVQKTVSVPAGTAVDTGRGCKKGFDILAPNGWKDLKYFLDHKSDLEQYSENLTNTSLTVSMRAPDGCDEISRVTLIYRLYYSKLQ